MTYPRIPVPQDNPVDLGQPCGWLWVSRTNEVVLRVALALLRDGFTVYGAARRIEKMAELEAAGGIPIKMDITVDADIANVVATIHRDHGRIDVLVNNAGYAAYGAVEDVSIDDARRQFEVNLFGLARLTQLVLPNMRARGSGRVINISSVGGKVFTPLGAWYHATKHALEGWSDCLRMEVEPFGIKVVIIEPGFIQTEFGGVLSAPLLQRARQSAYQELAKSVAGSLEKMEQAQQGSPPEVVARTIVRAATVARPKTRYLVGRLAGTLMSMRRLVSDRTFEKMILRTL